MASKERVQCLAGRYELGAVIGQGGMSRVHRAYDIRLSREVAVKVLHLRAALVSGHRARLEREALLTARINHPNVVTVFDVVDEDEQVFLVMELLPGRTLADEIALGPVDPGRVGQVATDVLAGLEAAHEQGVLHRDIKPSNVLFSESGAAKVADFGIARTRASSPITETGLVVGTPRYLPPERLAGHPASESGDLYSLGVVLYEALAGRPAFDGGDPVEIARAVATTAPTPIEELRPEVGPHLALALRRAMAHDPARRFASAASMAAVIGAEDPAVTSPIPGLPPDTQLLAAVADEPMTLVIEPDPDHTAVAAAVPTAAFAPVTPGRPARKGNRRARIVAAMFVVLLAGLLLLTLAAQRSSRPSPVTTSEPTATTAEPPTTLAAPTATAPASRPAPTTAPPAASRGKGRRGKDG